MPSSDDSRFFSGTAQSQAKEGTKEVSVPSNLLIPKAKLTLSTMASPCLLFLDAIMVLGTCSSTPLTFHQSSESDPQPSYGLVKS